jgi:hypothetical protein
MKQKLLFFAVAIFFSVANIYAQQLFSVKQNNLSKEIVTQLKTQVEKSEISTLSLAKNNENKDVYLIAFSSVENSRIIILNEQTGNHVTITPTEKLITEFQLALFFIEELKQGALGNAERYLIVESDSEFSSKNISSIILKDVVYIPKYFYGEKENVKEALPQDRAIIGIFKAKPRLIPAFPNDPENLRYVAQLEEEKSYYVYLYELPDGTLCGYDEHFNSDEVSDASMADGPLQFNLSGNTTGAARTATLHVFEQWGKKLAGKVAIDIQIDLTPMSPGTLGGSYLQPEFLHTQTNTWYPPSLYNQIVGYDATTQRDIRIEMNSNYSWYYGLDAATPSNLMDYVTVMLHEVNHGLGFTDNIFYETGNSNNGVFFYIEGDDIFGTDYPNVFSRQLFQGTSGPCISELSKSARAALITSGNLYAGRPGSKLLAANGGNRVKMYAPNPYEDGSSVCHWDYWVSFKTFMRYAFDKGESWHTIGTREIGILVDMGWIENSSTGDCNGVKNMTVNYTSGCEAKITWNAPAYSSATIANCEVRFKKEKEYKNCIKMAVYDASSYTLASYNFGENSGTSSYYSIPSGVHFPVFCTPEETWYYCLDNSPYSYNFQAGRKYTVVCSDDGTYLTFHINDDGGSGGDFKYNIYRDGALIKANHTETSYTDKGFSPNQSHTWTVKVACAGGGESAPATITKGTCIVGIETAGTSAITIYPNPTTGELRITNYELQITNVEIFDVFGRKIIEDKTNLTVLLSYDLTLFPAGIYFLKIKTEQGTITKKVIKQ